MSLATLRLLGVWAKWGESEMLPLSLGAGVLLHFTMPSSVTTHSSVCTVLPLMLKAQALPWCLELPPCRCSGISPQLTPPMTRYY